MAWEQRGGQTYYYRSVRQGGRVVKEYAGGGLMGTLAAEFDADARERRQHERSRLDAERERWADLDQQADRFGDWADALATAEFVRAGYRRHDRGEWRRRRG